MYVRTRARGARSKIRNKTRMRESNALITSEETVPRLSDMKVNELAISTGRPLVGVRI